MVSDPSYDEIKPLLKAMRVQFEQLLSRMDALRPRIAPGGLGLYEEMCDSLNMTFYRAVQVCRAASWMKYWVYEG